MAPQSIQRAVQRPVQAAMAAQRALGRAVTTNVGDTKPPHGVAMLNGQYYRVDLSGPVPKLVPCDPIGLPKPAEEGGGQDPDTVSGHDGHDAPDTADTLADVAGDLHGHRPDTVSVDVSVDVRADTGADSPEDLGGTASGQCPDSEKEVHGDE
ncbi:hypothetical protein [Streptomyces sp. NRRL S-350]|uniref:hypothetical protein n=1 Tax=Streptomyces sp. NRRL S-350 TaxID=1463902 RepID=UPI0004C05D3E|nr:hypothetical protein [Streptomyces sp. NRRL S-350]